MLNSVSLLRRCVVPVVLGCLCLPVSINAAAEDTNQQQPGALPLQELRNFTEIFDRIRSAYVEEIDDKILFEYAINGMLSSLDPHSAYLQADAFADLQENTSG